MPSLIRHLGARLFRALAVLLGVSLLTFFIGHWSGDPVLQIVRGDATLEQREQLRHSLGLDRPVLVQYAHFVAAALGGDLGQSYRQRVGVDGLILKRLPYSLGLAAAAFSLALSAAFVLGTLAARYRGRWPDHFIAGIAVIGQVVPGFWVGLVLVLLVAVHWQILPVSGSGGLAHLVLPAVTLALPTLGRLTRLFRSGMIEALGSDYVRTARAQGLSEAQIFVGQAARNALLPVLAQAGLELGDMVGSAFIIETVFAWPGIGRMAVNAVLQRDFLVLQGCVLVTAVGFVLINLGVDLLTAWADPRVRSR